MGQTPIEMTRERPALALLDSLQVFESEHSDRRPIHLLEGLADHRIDFGEGVLLPFVKLLNAVVDLAPDLDAMGEHEARLVIRIHADRFAVGFGLGPLLFQNQVKK